MYGDSQNLAYRQSVRLQWPRQLMSVLQVTTGVSLTSRVDMVRVARIVSGLKHNKAPLRLEFLANLEQFLAVESELKSTINSDMNDRVDITNSIAHMQDMLCRPYRPNSEGYFNFHSALNNLIQLKKRENVDDKQFVRQVIISGQPVAALYSATIICQFINATVATNQ